MRPLKANSDLIVIMYIDELSIVSRMFGFGPHSSYQYTDIHFSVTLYNSLVCNILEYAPVVWFSYHNWDCSGI